MSLSFWKDIFSTVQSVATVGAILVGGTWALLQFSWHREAYPHITLQQTITHRELPFRKYLLVIDVEMRNESRVQLNDVAGHTLVYQVLPLSQQMISRLSSDPPGGAYAENGARGLDWGEPVGVRLERHSNFVEPGDVEHLLYEFILPVNLCTVMVKTFISNPKLSTSEKPVGWERSTLYDLQPSGKCYNSEVGSISPHH